jgi:hypothetical protein
MIDVGSKTESSWDGSFCSPRFRNKTAEEARGETEEGEAGSEESSIGPGLESGGLDSLRLGWEQRDRDGR